MKILNFGSLNIDHVYRVRRFLYPGETQPCISYTKTCGGKGLNQSVALSMAGAQVFHAGLLGADGEFLRDKLMEKGVDCRYLRSTAQPSGHAVIQVEQSGQNCILLFPGTNTQLTMPMIDEVLSDFSANDVLLLQNEINLLPYLITQASNRGMRIAFNAAPMTENVLNYPLDRITWLFVNETEGAALSGVATPSQIAKVITDKYPQMELILTLGKNGCIYRKGNFSLHVPAKKVQALDTTAAGDTFTGFFLSALTDGHPPEVALELATTASAIAVTRIGAADAIPSIAEVIA